MKFYFDTEHNCVVSKEQIMREYIADHEVDEHIHDRIQNSLVCNGGTLVEIPGDYKPETESDGVSMQEFLLQIQELLRGFSDPELAKLRQMVLGEVDKRNARYRQKLLSKVQSALGVCLENEFLFSSNDMRSLCEINEVISNL